MSEVNREFDAEVLSRMAEGESLTGICHSLKEKGCPTPGRFSQRVLVEEEWAKQYARARELQMEAWADKIYHEASSPRMGTKTVEKADGVEITTGDAVDRSRLTVDALKWILARIAPKKYGDKITQDQNLSGNVTYSWEQKPPQLP